MANLIKPDLKFIEKIIESGGEEVKKCFQCATCSATCSLSPDEKPFPRKEMIWASWGLKEKLMTDLDIWLCYQCGDCTAYCPRGAKPSEVLSAIRRITISHYAVPSFLAKMVDKSKFLPLFFFICALLLGLLLLLKNSLENLIGISASISPKIIYPTSPIFPRWLLISLFLFFSLLVFILTFAGGVRYFLAIKKAYGNIPKTKGLMASILSALKNIITHDNFLQCTTNKGRFFSHACIFFGFIALFVVGMWVMTAGINPLFQKGFIYPFNFMNPLKIIANLGGISLVVGCFLMAYERVMNKNVTSTYFDWVFILIILCVGITGFTTELLHYARIDELRHIAYFIHLVFVLLLFLYLPYSKFAHIVYRTIAIVYSEYLKREKK